MTSAGTVDYESVLPYNGDWTSVSESICERGEIPQGLHRKGPERGATLVRMQRGGPRPSSARRAWSRRTGRKRSGSTSGRCPRGSGSSDPFFQEINESISSENEFRPRKMLIIPPPDNKSRLALLHLRLHQPAHLARIGLAPGLLHHLAHYEVERPLASRSVVGHRCAALCHRIEDGFCTANWAQTNNLYMLK